MTMRFWSRHHPIALQTLQVGVAAVLSPLIALGAVSYLVHRHDMHQDLTFIWYALGLTAALNGLVLSVWCGRTSLRLSRLKAALGSIGRQAGRTVLGQEGSHELPVLARAFNDVSKHLGLSIATNAAVSHIDRTILGSLDMADQENTEPVLEVATRTQSCLPYQNLKFRLPSSRSSSGISFSARTLCFWMAVARPAFIHLR